MSLLLALFEEHKQRTGHDFTKRDDERVWCCTVCNALYAEKLREDVDEARDAECYTANAALRGGEAVRSKGIVGKED